MINWLLQPQHLPQNHGSKGQKENSERDWEWPSHQLIMLMMLSSTGFAKHRLVGMVMTPAIPS